MTHHSNRQEVSRTMSHMTRVTWVIYDQKVSHTDQTHKKTIKNAKTWIFNANKLHHHHHQVAPPPAPSCTTTNISCTITNCIRVFTRFLKKFKNSSADQYLCNRTCWLTFNPQNHRMTDYIPPRAKKPAKSCVFGFWGLSMSYNDDISTKQEEIIWTTCWAKMTVVGRG